MDYRQFRGCSKSFRKYTGKKKKPRNLIIYDFSTLYTSIPHDKLKEEITGLVKKAFHGMNKKYIKVTKAKAYWSNKKTGHLCLDLPTLIKGICWLIDNTYVVVGDRILQQTVGIPMGTDCAPFLANLFLFSYEFKFLYTQLTSKTGMSSINLEVVQDISMIYF